MFVISMSSFAVSGPDHFRYQFFVAQVGLACLQAARAKKVFVMVEFHKRFDPIYIDARAKARTFGDFGCVLCVFVAYRYVTVPITMETLSSHRARWAHYTFCVLRKFTTIVHQCRYFSSYMSQPNFQLDTFRAWAGKSSDISYYLNSHHIDVHCWISEGAS